jgi:4-diphosphocytidyl-2-C-methyl-D-erythritol kinase
VTDSPGRLAPVVRLAPAKLNLTLAVIGRRPDGFHALHSVMVPLALADSLSLAAAHGRGDTLHVEGYDPGRAEENLVLRAIAAARAAVRSVGGPAGAAAGPVAARLEKRIPVAAGLAGGSSDAACALDAALELWGTSLDTETRARVAAALGSDVPFFLAGGPALVEGRGERVSPLPDPLGSPPGVLLVAPAIGVPTQGVFETYAAGIRPETAAATRLTSEHLVGELSRGLTTTALLDRAGILASANDLVPATAAIVPALVPFRRALRRILGRPVGQSGSGPTLWALYPSFDVASAASELVHAALADGRLASPGDRPPIIVATSFLSGGHPR